MPTENSIHLAAQAWCKPATVHKPMDPELALAFAEIIDGVVRSLSMPMTMPTDVAKMWERDEKHLRALMAEPTFEVKLQQLLNYYSKENGSDTPDFILAEYLLGCMFTWNSAVRRREEWYGRTPRTGPLPVPPRDDTGVTAAPARPPKPMTETKGAYAPSKNQVLPPPC